MRIDTRAFALAGGTVAAALSGLCALFVVLAPEAAVRVARTLFHVVGVSAPVIRWTGALSGLLLWFVIMAAAAAALAGFYNQWSRG